VLAEVLKPPLLADAARITAEGRGEDDPVGDNTAPEGRAANRRVEIMLAREGTYEAAHRLRAGDRELRTAGLLHPAFRAGANMAGGAGP
jgi:hypothetical protein